MQDLPKRKLNRLHNYDYAQIGAYFVTICTKDMKWLFGSIDGGTMTLNDNGIIVNNELHKISTHFNNVEISNYVVMPNHVHLIVVIISAGAASGAPTMTIGNIIRGYKSGVSRLIGFSPWQRNYHDHVIRNQEDYKRIAEYIENNPARWAEDRYYKMTTGAASGAPTKGFDT